ncbi:hypothetical protein TUW04_15220 (plasmid) [Lactiplantibacillus plantarum]|nr:hypothetical protein TUW04_15220 [Lactiplantibacillus plantarum]
MALIKKDADALHVNVEKTVDDTRKQKTITAKDRKSLRVDPDTRLRVWHISKIKRYMKLRMKWLKPISEISFLHAKEKYLIV